MTARRRRKSSRRPSRAGLTREINELKLYIATIFRVLVMKKIVSPDDLKDLIYAIDQEDGTIDNAFEGDPRSSRESTA